jgi:hypothetical protein
MLQTFDLIGAMTLAIDHYLQGKSCSLSIGEIARTRTAVQQRVLLLPWPEELNRTPMTSPKPNIYECCRLTALIFSVAVVCPVPNSYNLLQNLVRRLKIALEVLEIETCPLELCGVLLWMLVLGGIAASDKPERPWFASQFALIVRRLNIDWAGIEDILETFLWLESACGQGGRQLWDEAMSTPYILTYRLITPSV